MEYVSYLVGFLLTDKTLYLLPPEITQHQAIHIEQYPILEWQ